MVKLKESWNGIPEDPSFRANELCDLSAGPGFSSILNLWSLSSMNTTLFVRLQRIQNVSGQKAGEVDTLQTSP